MNAFFTSVYGQLLTPPLVGVATVMLAVAAYKLFTGGREGAERLAVVAVVIFLVAFAPFIVRTLEAAARAAGGFQ